MKGTRLKALALVVGIVLTAPSIGAAPPTRVTGTLIDLACYSQDKNDTGSHHRGKGMTCAQACAREGFEVALLATDGTIYHVRGGLTGNKNAKLVPYISQIVVIGGQVSEQHGQSIISSDSLEVAQ